MLLLWGPGLLLLMTWRLGPALLGRGEADAQSLARIVLPLALVNGGYFAWEALKSVVVDARGVRVAGGPARKRWSWDEIAAVDVTRYTLMGVGPTLILTDGTNEYLREAGGFSLGSVPKPAQLAADAIAEQLQVRRGTKELVGE